MTIDDAIRDLVLSAIRANPACLSRDIVEVLGVDMLTVKAATSEMYRNGEIERHAGMLARWSERPPKAPSIEVSGKSYQRWYREARRRGVTVNHLVEKALEAV